MQEVLHYFRNFARDEDGAQIIEYALIVAVVSLALVLLMAPLTGDAGSFKAWITKVGTCLSSGTCPAA